ncbi:MAG: ribonuclease PH [Deltaproteobacteria bacterium]|nr:ribonuclease PH [Deltaproteobacteria bacterium]
MKRVSNDMGRQVIITPNFLKHPEGSVLIETGDTRVICTASVDYKVNDWLRGKGKGWVTAEYAMLPRANSTRNKREGQFGRWPSSRSQEIQRLIGRCLRASVWPARLGELTITVDCDVIQADGGTRTASITGGWVALALALERLRNDGKIKSRPLKRQIAAVSVGMKEGECLLDLDYSEDSQADVDLNIAGDEKGGIVEVQGTAEGSLYSFDELSAMTRLGLKGIEALVDNQRATLASVGISLDSLLQRPEDL